MAEAKEGFLKSKLGRTAFIIVLLMLLGLILRIVNCFWAYPNHFHPDEPTIVVEAIDMIRRRSWEAAVYNRPDHFEIKCCAVLFQIVSFLKYHVSADIAFETHEIVFYLIGRGYTTLFGTAMIPVAYLLAEKMKRRAGLFAAALTAFYVIFVQHSAYATPDIVLTVLIMLITYVGMLFLENPTRNKIVVISILTGVGISTKYTCALCCIWIAFLIIYDSIKRKEYLNIIKWGLLAVLVVFGTFFMIAPNIFTNIEATIDILKFESRSTHLGADNLGFMGNMWFYFKTFIEKTGYEAIPFLLIGIFYYVKNRRKEWVSFIPGIIFMICTSVLALHHVRWGMPMYIFFVLLIAVGESFVMDIVSRSRWSDKTVGRRLLCGAAIIGMCVIFGNAILSSIGLTMSSLAVDTRKPALEYCQEQGMTQENTLYDGYTPFKDSGAGVIPVELDSDGKIIPEDGISYYMTSSEMYNRIYKEAERYKDWAMMYDAIDSQCELLARFTPYECDEKPLAIVNIIKEIQFIKGYSNSSMSGYTISIYRAP